MDLYFSISNIIQVIAIILSFVGIVGLFIMFFKIHNMLEHEKHHHMHVLDEPHTTEEAVHMYTDDWELIKKQIHSFQVSEWKLAVIQADKLVDEVLKTQGYKGESMGERLMSIDPNRFLTLQELWDAHKLRNQIVHDMSANITHEQGIRAIESYERFLRELGFFA